MNFKEYFLDFIKEYTNDDKLIKTLLEMPVSTGPFTGYLHEHDPETKQERLEEVLREPIIDSINGINVHLDEDGLFDSYHFVDDEYVAEISISKTKYYTDSLWKNKDRKDFNMRDVLLYFILPKYPYIESSSSHTSQAMNMWIALINKALSLGYKCSVVDYIEQTEDIIEDIEHFEEITTFIWKNHNTRPRIYRA